MKILFRLLTVFTVSSMCVYAQIAPPDTQWTRTLGGDGQDENFCVRQTSDGGFITVGYLTITNQRDVYLVKTDSSGNYYPPYGWSRLIGWEGRDEEGYGVEPTLDGGYIITGYTTPGSTDEPPDVLLIKTDALGCSLWTRTYGSILDDRGRSVQQTGDGGYIIVGYHTNLALNTKVYLIKTDSTGNVQWSRNYGGIGDDEGYSVRPTLDGGYIITGYTTPQGTDNPPDVYLIKTNSGGDTTWTRTFGGSGPDEGYDVQPTLDGGYIITGYTALGGTDDPPDVYLLKTDSLGSLLWCETFDGDNDDDKGRGVHQTQDGSYIITGYTTPGSTDDPPDVFLIKVNGEGVEQWRANIGGSGNDRGFSVMETDDQGYILTGYTESFGARGRDGWLVKVNRLPDVSVKVDPYNPPVSIGPNGGSFYARLTANNNTTIMQRFDGWLQIHLPGVLSVHLYDFENIWFTGAHEHIDTLRQIVPSGAPPGTYIYCAYVGDYPWVVDNYDYFTFVKTGPGRDSWSPSDWICQSASSAMTLFPAEILPRGGVSLSAYPNPFNAKTVASFELRDAGIVRLAVYDIQGREAAALAEGQFSPGWHQVEWDASSAPSGIYFVLLEAGEVKLTRKLLLVK